MVVTVVIAVMVVVVMAAAITVVVVLLVTAALLVMIAVVMTATITAVFVVIVTVTIAAMIAVMVTAVIAVMVTVMVATPTTVMVVVMVAAAVIGMRMDRGRGLLREGHGVAGALGDRPDLPAVDVRHGEDLDRVRDEPEPRRRRHVARAHPDVSAPQVLHEGRPAPSVLVEDPDRRLTDRELLAVVEPLWLVSHDDGDRALRLLEAQELLAPSGRQRGRRAQGVARLTTVLGGRIRELVHRQLLAWRLRSVDLEGAVGPRHGRLGCHMAIRLVVKASDVRWSR